MENTKLHSWEDPYCHLLLLFDFISTQKDKFMFCTLGSHITKANVGFQNLVVNLLSGIHKLQSKATAHGFIPTRSPHLWIHMMNAVLTKDCVKHWVSRTSLHSYLPISLMLCFLSYFLLHYSTDLIFLLSTFTYLIITWENVLILSDFWVSSYTWNFIQIVFILAIQNSMVQCII